MNSNNVDQYEKSAIVGYWRSGANLNGICKLSKLKPEIIKTIIEDHLANELLKSNKIIMQETSKTFKHWCIVELFGHNKIAGLCTEENIAGTNMLRVDVPETKKQPAFTKYYGSSAIYAINPVDEQTARIASENIGAGQVQEWNAETFIEKINASKPALEAPVEIEIDRIDNNTEEEGY